MSLIQMINRSVWGRVILLAMVCWSCFLSPVAGAEDVERFPPPEFSDGKVLPQIQTPAPRTLGEQVLDVAVLFIGLCLGSYFVIKSRSRRGIFWLGVFSLAYFGFYRYGCVCSIGSIQNVAKGIFDPNYSVSWVVLAFFFLPLIFTLFFGRSFCAGVCPQGAIQDLVALKTIELPVWLERTLRVVAYAYLGLSVLFAALSPWFIICSYDPFISIFRMTGTWTHIGLGVGFLIAGVFIGRPYCRFFCPYGVLLGWCGHVARQNVTITPDACVNCRMCEKSCPFNALRPSHVELKEPPRDRPRRLVFSLIALPAIILLFAYAGGVAGGYFAQGHREIQLAEHIRDHGIKGEDDLTTHFKSRKQKEEKLYESASLLSNNFVLGSWIFGGFMGLVVGWKFAGLSFGRRREEYHVDPEGCIACGRCYDHCPVDRLWDNAPNHQADMAEALSGQYAKEQART